MSPVLVSSAIIYGYIVTRLSRNANPSVSTIHAAKHLNTVFRMGVHQPDTNQGTVNFKVALTSQGVMVPSIISISTFFVVVMVSS